MQTRVIVDGKRVGIRRELVGTREVDAAHDEHPALAIAQLPAARTGLAHVVDVIATTDEREEKSEALHRLTTTLLRPFAFA
jgi:hypothetical protein